MAGVPTPAPRGALQHDPGRDIRFRAIDGLRAAAALMVFGLHMRLLLGVALPGPLVLVSNDGGAGVVMFFVISGFVLYRPFLLGRPPRLGDYAMRRFLRIYPAYLVALAGAALLSTGGLRTLARDPFGYVTMTHDYGMPAYSGLLNVAWTLQAEVCFYVALPLLAALVAGHRPRIVGVGVASFVIAWAASEATAGRELGVPMAILTLWAFATGMLVTTMRPLPALFGIPFGLVFVGLGLALGLPPWLDGLTALGSALLVATAMGSRSGLLRPAAWMGERLSYSFYLWQLTLMAVVAPLGGWPAALSALMLTAAVSFASSALVERPFMRLGHRAGGSARAIAGPVSEVGAR